MAVLDEKIQNQIDKFIDLANEHYDDISQYEYYMFKAWNLYPEPKYQWNEMYHFSKQLFDAYLESGEFNKAKEWLNKMIEHNNHLHLFDDDILFEMGKYHFEIGDYEKAYDYFQQLVKVSGMRYFQGEYPKYMQFYKNPETKGFAEEKNLLEKQDKIGDSLYDTNLLAEKGNYYFENLNFHKALDCYEKALSLLPKNKTDWEISTSLFTALGDTYFNLNDFSNAHDAYNQALQSPNGTGNPYIWFGIGQIYYAQKDIEKAKDCFMRAYMLNGKEIFEGENTLYFKLIDP